MHAYTYTLTPYARYVSSFSNLSGEFHTTFQTFSCTIKSTTLACAMSDNFFKKFLMTDKHLRLAVKVKEGDEYVGKMV